MIADRLDHLLTMLVIATPVTLADRQFQLAFRQNLRKVRDQVREMEGTIAGLQQQMLSAGPVEADLLVLVAPERDA